MHRTGLGLVLLLVSAATGQYPRLLVGTTDGALRVFTLTGQGKLQLRQKNSGPKGLRFVAFHPTRAVLYGAVDHHVQAYRIEKDSITPAARRRSDVGGTHVEVDPDGRYVYIASYGGNAIQAWPLDRAGMPGERCFDLRAPGELCRKAHQVRAHPSGRYVYAPCLGDDVLQILGVANDGVRSLGRTRLATGSGPRHMDFDPTGCFAYVINERSSSVYAFRVDKQSGALTEIQALTALPTGRTEFSRSSDIHVTADGRFVYAVHREPLDEVVAFRRSKDGKLRTLGHTKIGGVHSRSFALTEDGRFAVFAHSKTKNVIVRRIRSDGVVGARTDAVDVAGVAVFAGFMRQ